MSGKGIPKLMEPASRPRIDVKSNMKSKMFDLILSTALAGAFFVVFTKLYGCQQRLTELEKEMDDYKLMSSLQQLSTRTSEAPPPPPKKKQAPLPSVVEESNDDLEDIDDQEDPVEEDDQEDDETRVEEVGPEEVSPEESHEEPHEEEEEEETPPPVVPSRPKRKPR